MVQKKEKNDSWIRLILRTSLKHLIKKGWKDKPQTERDWHKITYVKGLVSIHRNKIIINKKNNLKKTWQRFPIHIYTKEDKQHK